MEFSQSKDLFILATLAEMCMNVWLLTNLCESLYSIVISSGCKSVIRLIFVLTVLSLESEDNDKKDGVEHGDSQRR